jgi:disulfide bond formation protein DsbB
VTDLDTANTFFTVLTLVANTGFVALLLVGLLALTRGAGRGLAGRAVGILRPRARVLAMVVAAVTTAGSLYYSEVKGLVPCELCWYQRICMYPLFAILLVGALRRDRAVVWYSAPFVAIGAPLALYHWLVERVPSLTSGTSCSVFVPCNVPYFEELGYVTLAFMDLSAFLLIGALLAVGRAPDGSTEEAMT